MSLYCLQPFHVVVISCYLWSRGRRADLMRRPARMALQGLDSKLSHTIVYAVAVCFQFCHRPGLGASLFISAGLRACLGRHPWKILPNAETSVPANELQTFRYD